MSDPAPVYFDNDVKQLIVLLLREFAQQHSGFQQSSSIASEIAFNLANRGLMDLSRAPMQSNPNKE